MNLPDKMHPKNMSDHWSRKSIVYQIYPLSFKDSNGDGKGDLNGIIEKLDYLNDRSNDSLGVNAVWLSPIYKSPMADFGYDISDFTAIDPVFGDMEAFDKLVTELHRRDIRLILDFVGNHTSSKHEWFIESRSSRINPKRDWYVWADPRPDGSPPNNWMSVFGGSAWEYDPATKQYYFHNFLKEQPDLNWRNPEVVKAMADVLDFWVKKGVDGFRFDALEHFVEDKLRRNDPVNATYYPTAGDPYKALEHKFSLGSDEDMAIIGNFINSTLERHPEIFIVGEAYVNTSELRKIYKLSRTGRLMPFNFNMIGIPWNAATYKKMIDEYQEMIDSDSNYLANYVLGNHDISRVASRVGEAQARLLAFLELTLPGLPCIYYGEEIGMTNGVIEPHAIRDILAKIFKGFHPGRDFERTPMQWNDSPHGGFTSGKPWLPTAPNYLSLNVENQKKDPKSVFSLYKSLIRLRTNSEYSDVLRLGKYVPRDSNSPSVFSFERHYEGKRLIVIANFGDSIAREILPQIRGTAGNAAGSGAGSEPAVIFSTTHNGRIHTFSKVMELLPYEGYVIKL